VSGNGLLTFGAVLSLLYFGRDVLVPITLALMLSLLVAPLVRALKRLGLPRAGAVVAAVLALALGLTAVGTMLGTQVVHMAASLPQYGHTIEEKLHDLKDMTVGRLDTLTNEATRVIEGHSAALATPARPAERLSPPSEGLMPVEVHEPQPSPLQILGRILVSVWTPVETTGIVVVVLVFVLLEQEALRDRVVRMVGGANIRLTTLALTDAGSRLSRYFVSQFAVNVGVGTTLALGLTAVGVPNATLWGTLAAALRFVPYVGVWIAALLSTVLALAIVPGWSLALVTLGLFILVELIAGQIVEPYLYGHTTGLSPLSVVVAAIFWSSLWGPIGLILSTPLTLCLMVLGHHIEALSFLEILLGDTQALTLPQRLYQRAIAGDAHEIIGVAREFLKHNTLAAYCDLVLMPALHMGFLDYEMGAISRDQQVRLREVIVTVVLALNDDKPRRSRRLGGPSVLDLSSPGHLLRQHREQQSGRWQGPLQVPAESVMLCFGAGAPADEIAAELLVRLLRDRKVDARHFSLEELHGPRPAGATAAGVAIVYLISAFPSPERERCETLIEQLRKLFPDPLLVTVLLPGMSVRQDSAAPNGKADYAVTSFVEAVRVCLERPLTQPP
jgi:predicted PurR-regulated permease PerM